jgi:hypothetical protein
MELNKFLTDYLKLSSEKQFPKTIYHFTKIQLNLKRIWQIAKNKDLRRVAEK